MLTMELEQAKTHPIRPISDDDRRREPRYPHSFSIESFGIRSRRQVLHGDHLDRRCQPVRLPLQPSHGSRERLRRCNSFADHGAALTYRSADAAFSSGAHPAIRARVDGRRLEDAIKQSVVVAAQECNEPAEHKILTRFRDVKHARWLRPQLRQSPVRNQQCNLGCQSPLVE